GTEMFVPSVDGTILSASQTSAARGGGSSGGPVHVAIHVAGSVIGDVDIPRLVQQGVQAAADEAERDRRAR
ncbi:MAG: hypothetical protein JWO68_2883, partial [Actinomycetia bacterium]|nr:hypothetical protein [Actinomycetes bacterium]